MGIRPLLILAPAVACAVPLLSTAQETQPLPSFRTAIDLVSLNVTVTNQSSRCFARFPPYWNGSWDGCPVRDLAEDTFEVLEDGVRQDIILFNRGSVPVSVSLLIDTSTGMEGRMIAVQTIPVWAKPIVASSRLGVRH